MNGIITLIILVFCFILVRPFTVLFHELGHSLAALIFTKGNICTYIGSYGDKKSSFTLRIGRLSLICKKHILLWKTGVCHLSSKNLSIINNLLITLAGPFLSLIIGIITILIKLKYDMNGFAQFILSFLVISTIFDFFASIIPSRKEIVLQNNRITYNDGEQIRQLIRTLRYPESYNEALDFYRNEQFGAAAMKFRESLPKINKNANTYRLAISCYIQDKDFKNAQILSKELQLKYKPKPNDLITYGYILIEKKQLDKALLEFEKALKIDNNNIYALNNRAYVLINQLNFNDAILDLDKAISLNSNFAYAFNNRGFAKIKLGLLDEGYVDLEKSLELDDKNAYVYFSYGVYYYEKGEKDKALEYFEKSHELDKDFEDVYEYLDELKRA